METNTKNIIKSRVKEILKLDSKISELKKAMDEGDVSPFLVQLFGKSTSLKIKLGQSIQTTMGMSFYEQTCQTLGESVGYTVKLQEKVKGFISDEVKQYLTMCDDVNYKPNRKQELLDLKKIVSTGAELEYPDSTVDVYIITPDGTEILIDITTVKPNKKEFRVLKEKLLRWTAIRWSQNSDIDVRAYIAFPYNPESTEVDGTNYSRHKNYYDREDVLVGEELWRLVSNSKVGIVDLVNIFEELGSELSTEIESTIGAI